MLEVCPDSEELVYDLTDVSLGGWVDEQVDLVNQSSESMISDFVLSRKIIVLTEGQTDQWVLERSINLLYPHLADYFHFLEFNRNKVGGGAGELANLLKGFAAAGILNRVIALFDNDTAAQSAISSLSSVLIPKNIVVLKYPDIQLCCEYPTLGLTGSEVMNVNGLAGSVELYFGEDVLRDENSQLTPIQWKGLDNRLRVYQGEILNKSKLNNKFLDKLKACESDPSKISDFDWAGIRAIIDEIRSAFHVKKVKEFSNKHVGIVG